MHTIATPATHEELEAQITEACERLKTAAAETAKVAKRAARVARTSNPTMKAITPEDLAEATGKHKAQ